MSESHGRAINVHQVELIESNEGYLLAITRECWRVNSFDLMGAGAVKIVHLVRVLRPNGFDGGAERNRGFGARGYIGAQNVAVSGVQEFRVGYPSGRKRERIGNFTRVGSCTGDKKLGSIHEHPDAVKLDVGKRLSIRGVAGGFDAAVGDAGDQSFLMTGGEVD